ncbi:hypothetical protein APE_0735.1 [Aeropyrum pernix ovoid virus 1]|uniref:Uncharacterized protein n=2 Tax=root TaxID=1 RepID=Q9YE34_AERPE|nr:hypothetical protein [Aeropyrum pernix]YP_009177669.1 hypothetical protein ASQ65_gp18 [Aeropyrum pernix ovoid virus 1]BAA79712.2 hypothetical protein APE_0735.1 [Aeropyrum pernix ovoid virus 1] [Aeropyrum pernix K1]CCD22159.1 TPA: hypothetical protein [Aeropyrum pernix ovoid virus 1]
MASRRKGEGREEALPLVDPFEEDIDWEAAAEDEVTGAHKIAIQLLAAPKGRAKLTLSDLSGGEVRAIATLRSIAQVIPDPVMLAYIDNYLLLKRSQKRQGVKEILAIVGAKGLRVLQAIRLGRTRTVREEEF